MNCKQLLFHSPKVLFLVKFRTNISLKPIDCKRIPYKMCSDSCSVPDNISRILYPPSEVKGMTDFNKDAFTKEIIFPALIVEPEKVKAVQKLMSGQFVKLWCLRPVVEFPDKFINTPGDGKCLLLNPDLISDYNSIQVSVRSNLESIGVTSKNFIYVKKSIPFDNWKPDDLISAVLPDGLRFSGYTLVGHIAHLNLRKELDKYKLVLGNIILGKIPNVETVVNKLDIIDNTFRNFNMEVICGKKDFVTEVKENGCTYKLDFSTVYWNSRLGREHERLVEKFNNGDVVYDVFAGVGPFSVPAAKKGCVVLANDLNPESVKWLKVNVETNKVRSNLKIFNKDGKDFILEDVKQHLLYVQDNVENKKFSVHIVMNLPSIAVNFLEYFKDLFTEEEYKKVPTCITMYVYCFVKNQSKDRIILKNLAKELIGSKLGEFAERNIIDIFDVRHVATNKDMFRITMKLGEDILVKDSKERLIKEKFEDGDDEISFNYPKRKSICTDLDSTVTKKHKQFSEN